MGPTPHSRPASAFGPARRRAVAASWAQGVQLGLGHLQHPQAERDASPGPPQAGCPERLQPHVVPGASGAARTVYSAVAGTQGVGCGCRPLSEYAAQYNDHRPHQSRDQQVLECRALLETNYALRRENTAWVQRAPAVLLVGSPAVTAAIGRAWGRGRDARAVAVAVAVAV